VHEHLTLTQGATGAPAPRQDRVGFEPALGVMEPAQPVTQFAACLHLRNDGGSG
jgi:hypothetical protein